MPQDGLSARKRPESGMLNKGIGTPFRRSVSFLEYRSWNRIHRNEICKMDSSHCFNEFFKSVEKRPFLSRRDSSRVLWQRLKPGRSVRPHPRLTGPRRQSDRADWGQLVGWLHHGCRQAARHHTDQGRIYQNQCPREIRFTACSKSIRFDCNSCEWQETCLDPGDDCLIQP